MNHGVIRVIRASRRYQRIASCPDLCPQPLQVESPATPYATASSAFDARGGLASMVDQFVGRGAGCDRIDPRHLPSHMSPVPVMLFIRVIVRRTRARATSAVRCH